MDVRGVDPRDTSWEVDHPVFRVYFFEPKGTPDSSHVTDEREVTGAEVDEVLAWADADGRPYIAYVLVDIADEGRGLVRLKGRDLNGSDLS